VSSKSASRFLPALVLLAATAACAAAPRPARVATRVACYALFAPDWHGAVTAATGLPALPSYVALDTTPVGPRGRRLIVSGMGQGVGQNPEWASWRVEGPQLVLTFLGPTGTLEVALRPTPDGYSGESVTPFRHAVRPVHVTLVSSSCPGLRA